MEIGGLPLHPLVVHGAVVFTPLAALALIVFAILPRYRYLTRWPAAILAVIASRERTRDNVRRMLSSTA